MKLLSSMDEVNRKRCSKCDYFNNDISLNQKKASCRDSKKLMDCELYLVSEQLKDRVKYLKGELGPIFIHSKGELDIEDYRFYEEDGFD